MELRTFRHKGLRRLYFDGDGKGWLPETVGKLRKILAFLQDMESPDELRSIPIWKAQVLSGGKKGLWSLHVTRNWRLTFRVDRKEGELCDLNLEDYH